MFEIIAKLFDTYYFYISCFLVIVLIDLYRKNWQITWTRRIVEGVFTNFGLQLVHLLLFLPFFVLTLTWAQSSFEKLGLPQVDASFWAGWPVLLLIIVSVVTKDLADYWNHRLMHTKWFWPIHAIHHSDPDVTATTYFRVHTFEPIVMNISYLLLLSWLNIPAITVAWIAVAITLHNMYVHINIDWHHGPFRYLLASPRYHRWHHADVPEAHGKNLANIFPFWDLLFGTYYNPGKCEERVGIPGLQNNLLMNVIWPYKEWGRMLSEKVEEASNKKKQATTSKETKEA